MRWSLSISFQSVTAPLLQLNISLKVQTRDFKAESDFVPLFPPHNVFNEKK